MENFIFCAVYDGIVSQDIWIGAERLVFIAFPFILWFMARF